MFTLFEQSPEFVDANLRSKELISSLITCVRARRSGIEVNSENIISLGADDNDLAYLIRDGYVRVDNESSAVFFHEPGDLLYWNSVANGMTSIADCRVVLDEFSRKDLSQTIATDPELQQKWSDYVQHQVLLYTSIISSFFRDDPVINPERRYAEPGTPIIIQNTSPTEVFTLLSGNAEVYVGAERVGEVLPGEIFGAMAASTNSLRTASVIAKSRCLYCALDAKNFLTLIRTHPNAVNRLIGSMARIIVSQNEKLLELQKNTAK